MKTGLISAIGTLLALCTAQPASAITVAFNPSSQSVSVGSATTVDLIISGLGDGIAPSLGTFDLDVGFDPTILGFSGTTFGNQLDLFGFGDVQFATPGVGTVNMFELSLDFAEDLDTLQADSFVLAILSFNALSPGSSPLSFSVNALGDSIGDPLQADLVMGSVGVVPEPAALSLMGVGILCVAAMVKRRRGKAVQC